MFIFFMLLIPMSIIAMSGCVVAPAPVVVVRPYR
jgi:hypothetical protein